MATTITPGIGKLGLRDLAQGAFMAGLGAVYGIIAPSIAKGVFTFDIKAIWHTAAGAAVIYLFKRVLTPAQKITPAPDSSK